MTSIFLLPHRVRYNRVWLKWKYTVFDTDLDLQGKLIIIIESLFTTFEANFIFKALGAIAKIILKPFEKKTISHQLTL